MGAETTVESDISGYDFEIKGDSLGWAYSDQSEDEVHMRVWNLSTNAWVNDAVLVSEDASDRYSDPQLIYHADGRITIIYIFYVNTAGCCDFDRRVMRKTYSAGLIAEIPEETLWSTDSELFVGPDMSAHGNANNDVIIVATHGTTSSQRRMRLWIIAEDGTAVVNNYLLISTGSSYSWYGEPEAYIYDNGDYVVGQSIRTGGFADPDGPEAYVIYGKDYNAEHTGIILMNSTSAGDQENVCIAKLDDGGFVAAWDGNGFFGDTQGAHARAYNAVQFPGAIFDITGTLEVDETGTELEVGITLGTAPATSVTVDFSSDDLAEGTVSPASMTFDDTNWDVPQTLTITGVDDADDDGDIAFNIVTSTSGSLDVEYATLDDQSFSALNYDDATITMPSGQTLCKSEDFTPVNALISNVGAAIVTVTAESSDETVVDNSDITVTFTGGTTWEVDITDLDDNITGTTTITLTANDGLFDYQDSFDVTTTGVGLEVNMLIDTICEGEGVTLEATGAAEIDWTGGITNGEEFFPESSGTYTVTGSDGGGCAESIDVTIVVNPAPPVPTITWWGSELLSSAEEGNQWFIDGAIIPGETNQNLVPLEDGDYTVRVTVDECFSISEPYSFSDVGIVSLSGPELHVYPNPANEVLNVYWDGNFTINLYTIVGQEVLNKTVNSQTTIDLTDFEAGTYILKTTRDSQIMETRIVIE